MPGLQQRLRGRPAHTPGPTSLSYTPNGRKLITVGSNNAIRIFQTGSNAEPTNIDDCQDSNTAVVAANDFFITGSEDGTVCKYSLETNSLDGIIVRCSLPVRDIALSRDGEWAAVASDETVVKVVNTRDMHRIITIRNHPRAVKHVSFDVNGTYLAVSCSDGIVYFYSLSSEEPQLIKKLDGVIKNIDTDAEASSKVIWHPDGRAFAAPTPTRDMQVISQSDWENQRAFRNGHTGDITTAAWSPNGALLATAGLDRKLLLWDTKTQKVIKTYDDLHATILAMFWHPTENILSYTNNDGELFIHTDIVPSEFASVLEKDLQAAPFLHDPLEDDRTVPHRPHTNGTTNGHRRIRQGTPDSLDQILADEGFSDDGFIDDDDGAGYAEFVNGNHKRSNEHLDAISSPNGKRRALNGHASSSLIRSRAHPSFQPGSTPWRGNRRYLCLNLTGFVWTVDQDSHHTITVEFYDRDAHRDFHFTDPYLYDKACLNENGTLFACPPSKALGNVHPSILYYRPHETWTTRTEWRTELPNGETATAIALSDSYVVVTTSANYVRIYSLFGIPLRVYRQKSSPTVTCAAWRDYVLTIGNGPIAADGSAQLLYTIENIKRDEVCQSEDILALAPGTELQTVFFSDAGDPYIYDTAGTLLVLLHWRSQGQAKWVPVLDTTQLERLASGRKEESYWPVAVANQRFHCIILKGGDRHPYFPRPLLSDFEFCVPITNAPKAEDEDGTEAATSETRKLEEAYILQTVLHSLASDLLGAVHATGAQKMALAKQETEINKTLLQLLAAECREGEERGMKALEIAGLLKDDGTARILQAATKVANRFGRDVLEGKIRDMGERRMVGLDNDEEL